MSLYRSICVCVCSPSYARALPPSLPLSLRPHSASRVLPVLPLSCRYSIIGFFALTTLIAVLYYKCYLSSRLDAYPTPVYGTHDESIPHTHTYVR